MNSFERLLVTLERYNSPSTEDLKDIIDHVKFFFRDAKVGISEKDTHQWKTAFKVIKDEVETKLMHSGWVDQQKFKTGNVNVKNFSLPIMHGATIPTDLITAVKNDINTYTEWQKAYMPKYKKACIDLYNAYSAIIKIGDSQKAESMAAAAIQNDKIAEQELPAFPFQQMLGNAQYHSNSNRCESNDIKRAYLPGLAPVSTQEYYPAVTKDKVYSVGESIIQCLLLMDTATMCQIELDNSLSDMDIDQAYDPRFGQELSALHTLTYARVFEDGLPFVAIIQEHYIPVIDALLKWVDRSIV